MMKISSWISGTTALVIDKNIWRSKWCLGLFQVLKDHAPLKRKRVKHTLLLDRYNPDILHASTETDKAKIINNSEEYKYCRNKVKNLISNSK
jgi:hypothetical protein